MNYTARAVAVAMLQGTKDLISSTSELETAIELGAARESLLQTEQVLTQMVDVISHLEVAANSLRSCGYSNEWLNTINADGSFLPAIGLKRSDLVGSDANKMQASMEGIVDTIWKWIKQVWLWIVNMFNRIGQFIKRFVEALKYSNNRVDRIMNIYGVLAAGIGPNEIKEICEAINRLGKDNKFFNIQSIADRMGVDLAIGTWVGKNALEITGTDIVKVLTAIGVGKDPSRFHTAVKTQLDMVGADKGLWSKFVEESPMADVTSGIPISNFVWLKLADVLATDAGSLPQVITIRNGDCASVAGSEVPALMKAAGIALNGTGGASKYEPIVFKPEIKPYEETVDSIDYSIVIKDMAHFFGTFKSIGSFLKKSHPVWVDVNNKCNKLAQDAKHVAKLADVGSAAVAHMQANQAAGEDLIDVLKLSTYMRWISKSISEASAFIGHLAADASKGLALIHKINGAVEQIAPQLKR
jgi:hypothetical protein